MCSKGICSHILGVLIYWQWPGFDIYTKAFLWESSFFTTRKTRWKLILLLTQQSPKSFIFSTKCVRKLSKFILAHLFYIHTLSSLAKRNQLAFSTYAGKSPYPKLPTVRYIFHLHCYWNVCHWIKKIFPLPPITFFCLSRVHCFLKAFVISSYH